MGVRFGAAKAAASLATWGLRHVFRRPAANFPGKAALYVDPRLIAHLAPKLRCGSVAVVGTNGKTTTANLVADALERAGRSVVCNRTGANLDSGVATALLHAGRVDWGVFECDELWLARILPQLRANYVLLLNLFRDQLDRVGEIDRIQDSIVGALASSPTTALVYNGDDPLCATIAARAAELPERAGVPSIAFGIDEDLMLAQNTVADATMCQRCSSMFDYAYRQYGQLGDYRCPNCGFARPTLDYAARGVRLGADGLAFSLDRPEGEPLSACAPFGGAYMAYNLAAVFAMADLLGCLPEATQAAIDAFDPKNGRLERFEVGGRPVLLNLAKNPTGFNQNLKIVTADIGSRAVAFFINDKEADGHDVSWLWDIDFEELSRCEGLVAFAGGIRARDMQVRLKYAGIEAEVVGGAPEMMARIASLPPDVPAYLIANYTALPGVKADLERLATAEASDAAERAGAAEAAPGVARAAGGAASVRAADGAVRVHVQRDSTVFIVSEPKNDENGRIVPVVPVEAAPGSPELTPTEGGADAGGAAAARGDDEGEDPLVVAHLFPDLLNLYGDGGNVRVLSERLRRRGVPCEVRRVRHGESVDLSGVDLVFLGGGPDREQRLASKGLFAMRDDLRAFAEDDGALLAICGGYQILGSRWLLGDEVVEGLGILDIETRRPGTSADRLVGNVVLRSRIATRPVVGYENHAGRTFLGAGVEAFGGVVSTVGHGNNDADKVDGALWRNVIGTYLHGPLLAKNPEVADWLLARALERRARRAGVPAPELAALDDAAEIAANEAVCARFAR